MISVPCVGGEAESVGVEGLGDSQAEISLHRAGGPWNLIKGHGAQDSEQGFRKCVSLSGVTRDGCWKPC